MRHHFSSVFAFAAMAVIVAVLLPPISAIAQNRNSGALPRTADGKVDLSGIWQSGGVSLTGEGGRGTGVPAAAAPAPASERPEYQQWAAEVVKRNADSLQKDDPIARCLLPGVPRIHTMPMPFQIVQTPGQVVILYEAFHAFRIIPTDGRKHYDDHIPSYMGDSVGRWEADTLVVDTIGFNGKSWIGAGGPTSADLHVVERFTRISAGTVAYEARIEDPKVLTRPYTTRMTFRRPPDTHVMEYECIDNNLDLPHLVGPASH